MSIAGCATVPPGASEPSFLTGAQTEPQETPDPFEGMNRAVFASNQQFNTEVVYPIAKAYREGVPEGVRDRVDAFTTNLTEPMVLANNVLQLRFDAAATTLARFITNSTVGLGGLFDVAATVGQKHQTGDFGQTFYVWGAHDTAYLVLPVLGPTTVRDGIGTGIGLLAPMGIVSMVPAKLANAASQVNVVDAVGMPVNGLGKVDQLQELEAGSLDFYAMLRSVSDQKRQSELREAMQQSLLGGQPAAATAPEVQEQPQSWEVTWQREAATPGRVGLGGQPPR
jgi:phospholipid-binding lipoprotein MlaA